VWTFAHFSSLLLNFHSMLARTFRASDLVNRLNMFLDLDNLHRNYLFLDGFGVLFV